MSKLGIFVGVYSVVMIILFFTFCFLMSMVNPPQIKQDPGNARNFGTVDFIYANEDLTNDNVAYGLEKVNNDYDSIDIVSKTVNKSVKGLPTIYIDKTFKTNCTRTDVFKMATRSMKHIKGLRRSINIESQEDGTVPRSVLLKIKDLDGQPRIEIKVIPDKTKSKKVRKYRSSVNITNKIKFDNDLKYILDNASKDVILLIENNKKLVFDFDKDSIHVHDDNNRYINNITINDKNDTKTQDKVIETSTKKYNDLLNTTIENVLKEIINKSESNQINERTENTIENEIAINSQMYFDTKAKIDFINNSTKDTNTKSYSQSDDKTDETVPGVGIANTLVGLLIPEATATLPFNYHFVN